MALNSNTMANIRSEIYPFTADLLFFDPDSAPLPMVARTLELTKLGSKAIEVRLVVEAAPALYRRLSDTGLLGLQRELRRLAGAEVATDASVRIDAVLGAGVLVRLSGCETAADAADSLLRWNRAKPLDRLFAIDSWFAKAVRPSSGGEGYTTFWANVTPSRLAREFTAGYFTPLMEAIRALAGARSSGSAPASGEALPVLEQMINYLQAEGWPYLGG